MKKTKRNHFVSFVFFVVKVRPAEMFPSSLHSGTSDELGLWRLWMNIAFMKGQS